MKQSRNTSGNDEQAVNGLTILKDPKSPTSAVNKAYVDGLLATSGYSVGDIKITTDPVTPVGFLRCNGGVVSSSTYPGLSAKIGERFGNYTLIGAGNAWLFQYEFSRGSGREYYNWTTVTTVQLNSYNTPIVLTKDRVYHLGSCVLTTAHTLSNQCRASDIYSDGSCSNWYNHTVLPFNLARYTPIVVNHNLYVIGGWNGSVGVTTVWRNPITPSSGNLGTWVVMGALPTAMHSNGVVVTSSRIYVISGNIGGSISNRIYYSTYSSNGNLSSWTLDSLTLPVGLIDFSLAVVGDKIYIIGGTNASNADVTSIYVSTINTNGTISAFSLFGDLPVPISGSTAVVTGEKVYLIGGEVGGTISTLIHAATINPDKSLSEFIRFGLLPNARAKGNAFFVNTKLYYVGGLASTAKTGNFAGSVLVTNSITNYTDYNGGLFTKPSSGSFALPNLENDSDANVHYYIKF